MPPTFADPDCPRCEGTGWVRIPDGGAGAATPCACAARNRPGALIEAAAIPLRYAECSVEGFRVEIGGEIETSLLNARKNCELFLNRAESAFHDVSPAERGLIFVGGPGVGKTHLAVAVLKELIRRLQVRGRFIDFTSFVARLQSTFDPTSDESKHRILDPVLTADVLVLDELGAAKLTPFVQDVLHQIINTRYAARRMTLFTTNFLLRPRAQPAAEARRAEAALPFDLSERPSSHHDLLVNRIPPMLVSRIREMTHAIEINSVDFRVPREVLRA